MMMKNSTQGFITTLLAIAACIIALSACNTNSAGKALGMSAAGAPSEVLLVMNEAWLKSEEADIIKDVLRTPVPALPQVEDWMYVQTVKRADFGNFLKNTRNILIVDNDSDIYTKTSVTYTYDEYANGQLIVTLKTPNKESMCAFLEEHPRLLCDLFLRNEIYRNAKDINENPSKKADEYAMQVFHHHIDLPSDVLSYKKRNNFLWLSNNSPRKRYDAVVFKVPYSKSQLPTGPEIIQLRDSVLGANIPGSSPTAHMSTAPYGAEWRYAKLPNRPQMVELRGIWEMTDPDMMAGPFVAIAYINTDEAMLYYIEGFVYYPNENKRDLVRMLNAAIYSFRPAADTEWDYEQLRQIKWGAPIEIKEHLPQPKQ